jgi:hypothetical protein
VPESNNSRYHRTNIGNYEVHGRKDRSTIMIALRLTFAVSHECENAGARYDSRKMGGINLHFR